MKNITRIVIGVVFIAMVFASCASFPSGDRAYSFEKGLSLLTREIIDSLEDEQLYRVAVNEFVRIDEQRTILGKAVAEELTTGFFNAGASFSLVERSQLEAALAELQLGMTAVFDERQAAELGRLVGADALVIGSFTPFEEYVKINARIFSVEDGRVIAAASVKIEMSAEVDSMLNNVLASGDRGTPASGGAAAPETREEPAPRLVQKIDDFQVELTGLRREGSKLWADFLVTYRGPKQEEWIGFYRARLVDSSGREYRPTHGGTMRLTDDWGGLDCVKDVPMTGTVPFDLGSLEVDSVALLEIQFRDRGKLYFKNLTVE